MIQVLDTCSLGVGAEPGGGFTIRVSDIEGMPGIVLMIPISKESAVPFIEGARKQMGAVEPANLADMQRMTRG